MSIRGKLVRQFMQPRGPLGHLAGWIMANRPSNRERNLWTVDLLGLKPDSTVLEVGCGPGLAIERCLQIVTNGHVIGLDHSSVMIAQAAQRNNQAIDEGRLSLVLSTTNALDALNSKFDRVLAVNVALFFPDLQAVVDALSSKVSPGGILAITHMPRKPGASSEDTEIAGDRLAMCFSSAGLTNVTKDLLPLDPVPAVCVRGRAA